MDTQIDQFLIEFHRRQRAQLLVPASLWARAMAWMKERMEGLELVPSLSYASAFAAIAITAFVGFPSRCRSPRRRARASFPSACRSHDGAFAMIPASFVAAAILPPSWLTA
jgi:hypothetical protein